MGVVDWAEWAETARRIRGHPRITRDELLRYQEARLRKMIRHAGTSVPLHQKRFSEAKIDPHGFRGLAELSTLPLLSKAELMLPRKEKLAAGWSRERVRMSGTSGSTGNPFSIWRTAEEARIISLFRRRAHREIGIRSADRTCALIEPRGEKRSWRNRLRRRLTGGQGSIISCLLPLEEIAAQLEAQRPQVVLGYPSTLTRVADYLAEHGRGGFQPRVVYTGGESLEAEHRTRIQAGFGTRVWDLYGAIEVDLVGWECPEGHGMHLCEDNFVAEILHDGEPVAEGEVGELVITALHNVTMPLIRYGLGDLVERGPAPCPCGQPFATLNHVVGRAMHYLELEGREPIHPFVITGPMVRAESRWIDQHQLVQEAKDRITFRILPRLVPPDGAVERLEAMAREELGPNVEFEIELVEAFEPDPSGKFRPYASMLDRSGPAI